MQVTSRFGGLLLLSFLVTSTLSTAYLVQGQMIVGGDIYAAGKCNLDVSKREASQIMIRNKKTEQKMVSDSDFMHSLRAKYRAKSRMAKSRESYGATFVAFNADYKGPRHHPPKNN